MLSHSSSSFPHIPTNAPPSLVDLWQKDSFLTLGLLLHYYFFYCFGFPFMCLHLLQHALYFLWMDFHPCLYIYTWFFFTWLQFDYTTLMMYFSQISLLGPHIETPTPPFACVPRWILIGGLLLFGQLQWLVHMWHLECLIFTIYGLERDKLNIKFGYNQYWYHFKYYHWSCSSHGTSNPIACNVLVLHISQLFAPSKEVIYNNIYQQHTRTCALNMASSIFCQKRHGNFG